MFSGTNWKTCITARYLNGRRGVIKSNLILKFYGSTEEMTACIYKEEHGASRGLLSLSLVFCLYIWSCGSIYCSSWKFFSNARYPVCVGELTGVSDIVSAGSKALRRVWVKSQRIQFQRLKEEYHFNVATRATAADAPTNIQQSDHVSTRMYQALRIITRLIFIRRIRFLNCFIFTR